MTTGELKYVNENVQKLKEILDRRIESVKNAEKYLHSTNNKEWKEITSYLLNFHMKYKESEFEQEEFDISTKFTLVLVTRDNSKLSYKDKIQNTFDFIKYSFVKHLNGQSLLHFYHHRCELKLINNVTASIIFFSGYYSQKKGFCFEVLHTYNPGTESLQTLQLFRLFRLFRILSDTQANICTQYR